MGDYGWRQQRRLDERAVVDFIRKHGYIGQETLGDVGFNWYGTGDGAGPFGEAGTKSKDYERIRAAAELRRQKPPKPKYDPDF